MNRDAILRMLLSALGTINIHPRLVEEIVKLVVGSGNEQRFVKLLLTRLTYLSHHGVNATQHEEFELIGGGVFSMHLSGRGFNLRILYSFLPDGDPFLLLCFFERAGKRATNYTPYIAPATKRFKECLEVYEHEIQSNP